MDFGKIPTEEEIVDFYKINQTNISLDLSNHELSNNKFNYLFDITKFSIEYLELELNFKINIKWDSDKGYIKLENDIIDICLNDEIKSYSIEEFK